MLLIVTCFDQHILYRLLHKSLPQNLEVANLTFHRNLVLRGRRRQIRVLKTLVFQRQQILR